jgi:tetratricopeptide (TPR) repeat protein
MELTINQALEKAVEAHKAGKVQEADRLYTAILKAQPKHPDANHNLGVLAVGVGKVETAVPFFKTALEANPKVAQFWLSYIDALIRLDRLTDANAVLDQAKSNGAKGDGFDKLERRLKETSEGPLPAKQIASEPQPQQPNILDSLKLDQALTLAKKKAKDGSPEDSKRIYQDILEKFPKNKRAIDGLKRLVGRPVGNTSKVQDPPQSQIQELINLYNQGQLQKALQQAGTLVQQFPQSAILFNIQGAALKGLGQLDQSVAAYTKALSIKPDYAGAHYDLGDALKEQGKLEEAIEAYTKALSIKPDYAESYNNLGNALKDQGKLDEAIEAYTKALSIKPDYAEAYNNLGVTLIEQGKLEEAIEAYNKALAINPDYAEAWSNGAGALEKWNKLKELGLWLERAFQNFEPVPSDLSFMKVKLLWRNKNTEEAIKLISNIDVKTITAILQQDYLNLRAKLYESSKDYDLAFNCFDEMNSLATKSNDYLRLDPESYFQRLSDQLAILNSNSFKKPANNITEQNDLIPVFLVGFPRSGTTLLDTILRSHSSIYVVEEQPLVSAAKAFVEKSGYAEIGQTLPQEVIAGARNAYFAELDKHGAITDSKSILIDKLPLNLLHIPFIQQLYPQAKFILALRHPLDTILSCWMQNFKLNSAMANMVDLDRISEFYCVAMETFKISRAKYNLSVHQIRYEDLLEDFIGETSALLNFLDLDWEDQMKNFQETALKRGRINTPSYSQVVQPIYNDAKYRWLNYEKHLRKYITKVEPWINEFGYGNQ